MLDIEFIPKILKNMILFLENKVPSTLLDNYCSILEMDPLEQKSIIQRELKPYELSLNELIEKLMSDHGLNKNQFSKDDLIKFKRYLEALCESVH